MQNPVNIEIEKGSKRVVVVGRLQPYNKIILSDKRCNLKYRKVSIDGDDPVPKSIKVLNFINIVNRKPESDQDHIQDPRGCTIL